MSGSVAVVGGGSWGTALALQAARRCDDVRLWFHDPDLERIVRRQRENPTYLPGHPLPPSVRTGTDLPTVLAEVGVVMLAVPSPYLRAVSRQCAGHLPDGAAVLVATKGLEEGSLLRMSQVVEQEARLGPSQVASLSGPSFARELAEGQPTAVVVAAAEEGLGRRLQAELSHGPLRIYRNPDRVGVELGGALKNVIALAAGILEGLGHGHNTSAALLTRGLHEMTRLAVALGGDRASMAGLAGMGDLVLTCTGRWSRNRAVGIELGRGRPLAEILAGMKMVAEGVWTCGAARELSRRHQVEMPITQQVHAVLHGGLSPAEAIAALLARDLKEETAL